MNHHNNISYYSCGPNDICSPGLWLPLFDERHWNIWVRRGYYLFLMLYIFVGIDIITEIFLRAIDEITSTTKKLHLAKLKWKRDYSASSSETETDEDIPEVIEVRVWNDTVANLLLVAFGSASPDVLLSIVETAHEHFQIGSLATPTIIGSAAFNLLIFTAICLASVPKGETRKIKRFNLFVVTWIFSLIGYLWLYLVVSCFTPGEITIWEMSIAIILFPLMVLCAYIADEGYHAIWKKQLSKNQQMELGPIDTEKNKLQKELAMSGDVNQDKLIQFIKEVKKVPGLTDEEIALLTASKLIDESSHSAGWHRIRGSGTLTPSTPVLGEKLKQVYEVLKAHPEGLNLGDLPEEPNSDLCSVVGFHASVVAVKEDIGTLSVPICRHGNLEHQFKVMVESIDGSAKHGEDYEKVKKVLVFQPHEKEKQLFVNIIDDRKWEPEEEFFLRLTIPDLYKDRVTMGTYSIMEVTIMDNDEPGVITFEKRGMVVKESAGKVRIGVIRRRGADGDVSVKWKTIDKTAINGRDYVGGEGKIHFKHNEVKQYLELQIIDDMDPEKDEYFEVILSNPTGGALIGNINNIIITLSNDDDFTNVVHRLMSLTNTNLDAIRIHTVTWKEQIKRAMNVNSGNIHDATASHYISHFVCFFWKTLFSLIPPTAIFGGWLCFIVALILLGFMTALIADVCKLFGCLIGLNNAITAITIVALGTSIPDITGARHITKSERSADGALLHISGSVAVNILIGVGVPWFVAAIFHKVQGSTFYVPELGIGFNTLLFLITATIAFVLLLLRRNLAIFGYAELGGPRTTKIFTIVILIMLWIFYITIVVIHIRNNAPHP